MCRFPVRMLDTDTPKDLAAMLMSAAAGSKTGSYRLTGMSRTRSPIKTNMTAFNRFSVISQKSR